jgi:alpha-beta hydrolase superfamily lysophospholipase
MRANRTLLNLVSEDGTNLAAQRWSPLGEPRAALLVIHGYAEHAERYRELGLTLAERGIDTVAVDLRGHGRSAGQRGFVDRFSEYHADAEAALAAMTATHAGRGVPRFVLAHSNGGLIALDWVSTRKPDIRGLILSNPFLELAMKAPRLKVVIGHIAARLAPHIALPSGLPPESVSHDTAIVDAYRRDPMVFTTVTAGYFRASRVAQVRVRALRRLDVPLFYAYSDADPIAAPQANAALAQALDSPDKTVVVRTGEFHEILNEVNRAELMAQIGDWILAHA